ncbi:MAG: YidC/Oxa1 family membrane protein insertase [Lachnospiraceae bacterium]|nr:YidC/Oxa1 family membrane protein insertase [Lachnospiraceae bacterium]
MELLVLTKVGGFLGPFATIFGWIFNLLYILLDKIYGLFSDERSGIVAITVILFTIVTKLLMTPLTIKQQKFSKMSSIMNPELTEIQEKYKNKRNDEKAMHMMQMEQQAVYDKYGTSPTAGCLPMLIMFPLMFALYRIIYAIPAYVPDIYELYNAIAEGIKNQDYFAYMSEMATTLAVQTKNFSEMSEGVFTNAHLVDIMTKFGSDQWTALAEQFPSVADIINVNAEQINAMHSVWGFNLLNTPQHYGFSLALLIPVLAIVTQLFQSMLSMAKTKTNKKQGEENAMVQSMNSMMYIMPFMSGFMCWMFPICVGIYWIASTVVTIIYQFFINRHIDKMDMNEMIKQNVEKMNKKREKMGIASGNQMAELAKMQTKSIDSYTKAEPKKSSTSSYANATGKNYTSETTSSANTEKKSVSGYANMLKKD